jgi:hypothetical protein
LLDIDLTPTLSLKERELKKSVLKSPLLEGEGI